LQADRNPNNKDPLYISTYALFYFSLQYEPLYRTPSTGLLAMKCSSPACLIRVDRIYSGEEREGLVCHCKLRTVTMRNSRFALLDEPSLAAHLLKSLEGLKATCLATFFN